MHRLDLATLLVSQVLGATGFAAFLGNVAYATLLMSAIGNFFPIFKGGNTLPSIIVASFLLWGVHFLILRGVETAAFINSIVTVAKLILYS